jgi:hypothetical protein
MEGSGDVQIITDPEAELEGTKTFGSGSGTLPGTGKVSSRYGFRQTFFSVSIFSTWFYIKTPTPVWDIHPERNIHNVFIQSIHTALHD